MNDTVLEDVQETQQPETTANPADAGLQEAATGLRHPENPELKVEAVEEHAPGETMDISVTIPARDIGTLPDSVKNMAQFQNLDRAQQEQLEQIFSAAQSAGAQEVAQYIGELLQRNDVNAEQLSEIIDHLHNLSDPAQTLQQGLNKAELLHSLLWELGDPDRIHQSSKATCPATELEVNLCSATPEEYARMMSELAINGKAEWAAKGHMVELNSSAIVEDQPTNGDPPRLLSSRLFQTAAMDFANGSGKFDCVSDLSTGGTERPHSGLYKYQWQLLHNVAFNTGSRRYHTSNMGTSVDRDGNPLPIKDPQELLTEMDQHCSENGGVMCEIRFREGTAHELHCVTYRGTVEENGKSYVIIHNPWSKNLEDGTGGVQKIEKSEFLSMLTCAVIPDETRAITEVDTEPASTYRTITINGQKVTDTRHLSSEIEDQGESAEKRQRGNSDSDLPGQNNAGQQSDSAEAQIDRRSGLLKTIDEDMRRRAKEKD